jgi:diaminopimelate epimerase
MNYTKMNGLGNSYVIFCQLDDPLNILPEEEYPVLSQRVSDENFGIGSDGIILISDSTVADFKMRIFNKDGSEAMNCGNGLRCVAKYVYDYLYTTEPQFTIETKSGVVHVEVEKDSTASAMVTLVNVNMGAPILKKAQIPMQGNPEETAIDETYTFEDEEYQLTSVSMGNPHTIMFTNNVRDVDLEAIGPMIEHNPLFPQRVNVGVVELKGELEMHYRVWERGSGITMACGTGACAAVVAATLNGHLLKTKPITVHLPGGDLQITWEKDNSIWKKGKAAYICHGELDSELNKQFA